jgi:hypothetical protein
VPFSIDPTGLPAMAFFACASVTMSLPFGIYVCQFALKTACAFVLSYLSIVEHLD